jgi:hypothetical protein
MSKTEKRVQRFLSKTNDFTFEELRRLLKILGYKEAKTGKTSGSRVAFYNAELDDMIRFHKPHPSQTMKRCYLNEIGKHLRERGVIK